jgi:hypothetical protein
LTLSPDGDNVELPASATTAELSGLDWVQERTVEVSAKCGSSVGPIASADFFVVPTPVAPPALSTDTKANAAAAAAVNQTKTIKVGTWLGWDEDEVTARQIQWQVCTSTDPSTCKNSLGVVNLATGKKTAGYTPLVADVGKILSATVSVTYPGGVSSASLVVGPILPAGTDLAAFAAQGTTTPGTGDPGGPLASTGVDSKSLAWGGFGLVCAGVALMMMANRRQQLADELVDNFVAAAVADTTNNLAPEHFRSDRLPPPGEPPPGVHSHRQRRGGARPKCAHRPNVANAAPRPNARVLFPQGDFSWLLLLAQQSSPALSSDAVVPGQRAPHLTEGSASSRVAKRVISVGGSSPLDTFQASLVGVAQASNRVPAVGSPAPKHLGYPQDMATAS